MLGYSLHLRICLRIAQQVPNLSIAQNPWAYR